MRLSFAGVCKLYSPQQQCETLPRQKLTANAAAAKSPAAVRQAAQNQAAAAAPATAAAVAKPAAAGIAVNAAAAATVAAVLRPFQLARLLSAPGTASCKSEQHSMLHRTAHMPVAGMCKDSGTKHALLHGNLLLIRPTVS
jgi:hypothetical protein